MHFLLCCWSNFLECVQTRCPQPVNRSYSRKQQGANKKLDKWIDSRTTCGGNGMMAAHAPVPSPHMSWYVAHLRFACLLTLTDLLRLANPPASILCYDSANCQVISLLFFFPHFLQTIFHGSWLVRLCYIRDLNSLMGWCIRKSLTRTPHGF